MQINPLEKSSFVQTRIFPRTSTVLSLEKNEDFLDAHNEGFLILSYCFAISLFMYIVLKNFYYLHIFKRTRMKIIESINNDNNIENEIEEIKKVKNLITEQVILELRAKSIISKGGTRKHLENDLSHNAIKEDINLKENEIEMSHVQSLEHLIQHNLLTEILDTKEKNAEFFIKFLQQLMIIETNKKQYSNNILLKDLIDYIINIGKKQIQKSNTQLSQNYSQNYISSSENDIYIFQIQVIKELIKNNIIKTHTNDGKQLDHDIITKILEESLISQANVVNYFYIEMIKKILGKDYNELKNLSYTHDDMFVQKYEKELIKKKLTQFADKNIKTTENNKYLQDKTVNKHIDKNQIDKNENTTNLIEKEQDFEKTNKLDHNEVIKNNISLHNENNEINETNQTNESSETMKNIVQYNDHLENPEEEEKKNEEIETQNQHKKEENNSNDNKNVKKHSKKSTKNFKRKRIQKEDIRHLYQIDKLQDKILKNLMGQDYTESDINNNDKEQLENQTSDIQNEKLNISNEQEETRKTNNEEKQNEVIIDQDNTHLNIYGINNQSIQNHNDKNIKEKLEEENILTNNIVKPEGSMSSEASNSSYESTNPEGSMTAEGSYSSYESTNPEGSMTAEGSYSSYESIKDEENMTSQNNYSSYGSNSSEEYKNNMDKIKMYDEIIKNGLIDRVTKPRNFKKETENKTHYNIFKNKENKSYVTNWNNEKFDIKELENKSEQELEQWKNKQWDDWKVYMEKQWKVWLELSENDKIEWLEEKEREFRSFIKDIYNIWFKWLEKMKNERSGEQKPWMTWNEQQWQTFFDTRYKKQFLDEWNDMLKYMDKILSTRKFTLWNKWKGKKLTQWLMQEWKLQEDDIWEEWEEKGWVKHLNRKKKNEWKKWRNRNIKENMEWKEWIHNKGQSANVSDFTYWEEWKENRTNELKEWLDALIKKWMLEGKWKELVINQDQ